MVDSIKRRFLSLIFYYPFFYTTYLLAEIYSYLVKLTCVSCKRHDISLVMNLLQCFFGSTVKFEFHNIYVLVGFHYHIYTTVGGVIFRLRIEAQKFEYDKEYILIVQFQIACQFVWSVCKETLQAFQESFGE